MRDARRFVAPVQVTLNHDGLSRPPALRPFLWCLTFIVPCTGDSLDLKNMDWPDYLRDQAAMYRRLAEQADDPVVKTEMLELASVCEEVANDIEDHLTGG